MRGNVKTPVRSRQGPRGANRGPPGGRNPDMVAGAERLRAERSEAGWSQEQLAAASGVSVRTIRNLEGGSIGRPRRSTVDDLTTALGLVGASRRAFRGAWGGFGDAPVVDPQEMVHRPQDFTRLLDRVRGRIDQFAARFVRLEATVSPTRRIIREEHDRVVTARRSGLDELPLVVGVHALPSAGAVRLQALSECRLVGRTQIPEEQVVVFDLALGRRLRRGESHHYRVGLDYRFTRTNVGARRDEARRALVGLHSGGAVAVVQVRFPPHDPPRRCLRVFEESMGSGVVDGQPVRVSADGSVQSVLVEPPPGWHGLRWEW